MTFRSTSTPRPGRRNFLRSSTAVVALPFLESLGFRKSAAAAKAVAPPKRLVFLGMGFGVTRQTWFPDIKQSGTDYELSEGLQPLADHKQDLTVIQNLSNQFSTEAHWGSTFWLTGANRYAEPGQSFYNSVSADQVAAETLGRDTRFTSIQLGHKGPDKSGHGPGLSLAWNRQGKPIAALNTPVAAFHRLFSDDGTPLEERQAALRKRRSVLDTVLENARSVGRGLTKADTDKLDEYFQSIREIEIRLAKEEDWLDVPKLRPEDIPKAPDEGLEGFEEVKIMYDLILAAMQVDASRVFTYRQPLDTFITSLGATITAHNMSHYRDGARKDVSRLRDKKQSELLAHFIQRMKATPDVGGTTLFDNCTVTLGSNINSIHYLTNCPTVVTGGGAGIKHGRQLVMDDTETPLCNLWLSILNASGSKLESHGDSTGEIAELFG